MNRSCVFLLFLSSLAFGQGVILPTQQALKVVNGITSPVANATITVCAANTSGIPCSPALVSAVFKDAALTQPLTNPFTSDANGNYVFAIAPGNYTVTVTGLGFVGYSYQTTAPLSAAATNTFTSTNTFSGATNLSGGGSLTGTFSGGPATFTGTNSFTGTTTSCQQNAVLYVGGSITCWSGSDIGAQINTAYAALPISGGFIYILPQAGGACYNYSTPIVLNTLGRFAVLAGAAVNADTGNFVGACLNYTPTTATSAITIDWGLAGGSGNAPGSGIRDMTLINNLCFTRGGCGSSAIGFNIAPTNGGIGENGLIQNVQVMGFSNGFKMGPGANVGWGIRMINDAIRFNTTGINYTTNVENDNYHGVALNSNATGINLGAFGAEISWIGGSVDDNTTCGINLADGAILHVIAAHWENTSLGTPAYVCGSTASSKLDIQGGIAYDDATTGSISATWFSAGMVNITGLTLNSNGRTNTADVIVANTRGKTDVMSLNGSLFTGANFGAAGNLTRDFSIFTQNGAGQAVASVSIPVAVYWEQSVPGGFAIGGADSCYGDNTAHTVKCSFNATNYHSLRLTEVGTCTMAAGTCTLTWGTSFTATPLCNVTWNGTGALTGIVKAVPSTTNCVVTSSVNTDTGVMQIVGTANPN